MGRKSEKKGRSTEKRGPGAAKKGLRHLDTDELSAVSGGQWKLTNPTIRGSNVRSRPGSTGPTVGGPTGSIAQGDTLDNTLTEDGLP